MRVKQQMTRGNTSDRQRGSLPMSRSSNLLGQGIPWRLVLRGLRICRSAAGRRSLGGFRFPPGASSAAHRQLTLRRGSSASSRETKIVTAVACDP